MIIFLSLLVSVVGLIIYLATKDGKVSAVGLAMFWVGLLAFLLQDSVLLRVLPR